MEFPCFYIKLRPDMIRNRDWALGWEKSPNGSQPRQRAPETRTRSQARDPSPRNPHEKLCCDVRQVRKRISTSSTAGHQRRHFSARPPYANRCRARSCTSQAGTPAALLEGGAEIRALDAGRRGHDQPHNEPVQSEGLREDEDEDHADEESRLLRVRTHARVADNSDCESSREGRHADSKPCPKVRIPRVLRVGVRRVQLAIDDDRSDEPVDAKHTG